MVQFQQLRSAALAILLAMTAFQGVAGVGEDGVAKNINYSIKVGVIGDAQLQKFQRTVEQINRSSDKTSRSVQRMGNQMSKLGAVAKVASAAMAIFYSARGLTSVIAQADAMRNLEASDWFSSPNLDSVRAAPEFGPQATTFNLSVKIQPDGEGAR